MHAIEILQKKIRRIILAVLFIASPAMAQNTDDLFSLSLEELSKITIASRVEESFINAPSSVSVITRAEIKRLGVRTLSELMNYVPGFQSYMSPNDSNRSMYVVRGLADVYGQNLLLMIDGHRINDEYTGGFTFADHLIGLHNAKQVEFIRGPGSALYGSNAFSGVINIITDQKREYATVTTGSNNARGVAAAAHGKTGNLKSNVAFSYYRDNGQSYNGITDKNGFNKSTQDPVDVFEGRVDLTYKRSHLIFEYMETKLSDYYVFRRINNGTNKNNTKRIGAYFEYDFEMPERWQGNGRIGAVRHVRHQEVLLTPLTPSSLLIDNWQQDTLEAQLDFNYLTQGDHQLSMGAYIGAMDIPIASDTSRTDRYAFDESRNTLGVYIQDQFNITNDVRLTAGLRYDDYSDFGNSANPRLALHYQWRDNSSFKVMYGRAYRAPSMAALYDKENFFSAKTPELDAVTVDSYEIAYLYSKDSRNLTATFFYNDSKDFFTSRTLPSGLLIYDNVYDNQSSGLELDLSWRLDDNWSTSVGLTHILSNNTQAPSGTLFTPQDKITPSNYGNLRLNYQRQKWNWNISMVTHDGIELLQDQGSLFVVNTKFLYQLKSQWELGVNIRNMFDKIYSTPQSFLLGTDQFGNAIQELPSRGREFFISLRYSIR